MKKISDFIIKKPKLIITISLLLLIPTIISFLLTNVNYDLLTYLPSKLDSVKAEQILEENFNGSSLTIVLVKTVDDNGDEYSPNTVMKLKNRIGELENVSAVLWSDNILDSSIPGDILPDDLKNVFYSSDGEYTMMFVSYDENASSKEIINTVDDIKELLPEDAYLSGISAMNADTKSMTDRETPFYIAVAVILVIATMMITMESFVIPLIIIAVIGIAVAYNMGTNFFMEVSYITQSIAAILQLGVTIDYSIFLVNRYNEERKYCLSKEEAMARSLQGSLTSLSGSSLTTLFGFLALCFMQLTLGMNIGIVMAKGVVIGVLTVVIILPAFLLVFDDAIMRHRHKAFTPNFSKLVDFILKKRKVFAAIFLIIIIPAFILANNVEEYYNLNSQLPEDSITTVGTAILKEKFNMTTSHFIIVDDSIPSKKLVQMENEIEQVEGVSSMLAYDKFVGTSIPDTIIPDSIIEIIKKGGYQVMLVNSIYEASTDESNAQVEEIEDIIHRYTDDEHYGYITGEGALYKDLIKTTKVDFTVTSAISIVAVFLVIAFVFKSATIPVVLILGIEVAIWINEGISTLMGSQISFIAPTVISCIQLGATVDYAIMLTSRFKEELSKGFEKKQAMRKAANEACLSIFQSATLFFFATFGVYLICSISIVKSLCALLARGSIISALVIILFVAPILLICEKMISKTIKVKAEPKQYEQVHEQPISDWQSGGNDFTEFSFTDDEDD